MKKIEYTISDNTFPVMNKTVTGKYEISVNMDVEEMNLTSYLPMIKSRIEEQIERIVSKDLLDVSFSERLDDKSIALIVEALTLLKNQIHLFENDVKFRSKLYQEYNMIGELIYRLRTGT